MFTIIFQVEIVETLARTINIEANTEDEAHAIVKQRYRNCEIILSADDFADVDFVVKTSEESKG